MLLQLVQKEKAVEEYLCDTTEKELRVWVKSQELKKTGIAIKQN